MGCAALEKNDQVINWGLGPWREQESKEKKNDIWEFEVREATLILTTFGPVGIAC